MNTAIWWVRRDLRLHDNPALQAALEEAEQIVPVFVLDKNLLDSDYVGPKRTAFLFAGLHALDDSLRERGSRLVVRRGNPVDALSEIVEESGAMRVFAQEDFSPYARVRDRRVERSVPLSLTPGVVVHHPNQVRKDDGDPYIVYSPYARTWRTLDLPDLAPDLPQRIASPDNLHTEPLPESEELSLLPAGESAGQAVLKRFVSGEDAPVFRYADDRNRVDLAGTSGLSPYLRFGMVSARQAVEAAMNALDWAPSKQAAKGADTWLNELIWREFYSAILYHFPHVRRQSFREAYRSIEWANDQSEFEAWCAGRTGYPLVDAAMRQLEQTGWMHNRARMVVASFLTKDLLIDWRWGEKWFMQHLIDGDPASNNGGWQWSAGTGTDAAPYFRIFNPVSQSTSHDPDAEYIRKYVPELQDVPDKYIHEPWEMPEDVQAEAGCLIGEDYPGPIVDHQWARERALGAYKEAKD